MIVEPSGRVTLIGAWDILLLWHGTLIPLKCPVDPVSAIAVCFCVGGPSSCVALFTNCVTMLISLCLLGSPPRHAVVLLFTVGVGALNLSRRTHIFVLPFCMLLRVAVRMWPSAGYLHLLPAWLRLRPCDQQYFQLSRLFFDGRLVFSLLVSSGCCFRVALYPALEIVVVLRR
jgi:hypothetical protein